MPTYDYQCTVCSHPFVITHSIHDDAREQEDHLDAQGDKCEGKLKRLISPSTVVWKNGPPTGKHYV